MSPRALVIGASPEGLEASMISRIAAECDVMVAVDGGAVKLLEAGVTPHVVVGDLDSLDPESRDVVRRLDVPFEIHSTDKDESDLDLALRWCRARGVDEIHATHVWGGRLDHSLAAAGSFAAAADMRPVVHTPRETVRVVSADHNPILEGFVVLSTLSIVALTQAVVSLNGVRWPLEEAALPALASLGISNVVTHTDARLVVHRGTILVCSLNTDGRP